MSQCLAGVGRVDITPNTSGWASGYSALGQRVDPASPDEPRLVATAVALVDSQGNKLLILHADLHCASSALRQHLLARLPWLRDHELILSATHTHLGPGHFYGNPLFDAMTTAAPWPLPSRLRWLGDRLVQASQRAWQSLAPADLGVARPSVPGMSSNRSMAAFARNPPELRQAFAQGPAQHAQDLSNPPDRCVDPRLTLLVVGPPGEQPVATLAWYACHGTALGSDWPRWSAEWAGYAREAFEAQGGGLLALANGCTGDVSPLPLTDQGEPTPGHPRRPAEQGLALAQEIGRAVATAASQAISSVSRESFDLAGAHLSWEVAAELGGARYGLATLGGAVDGRNHGSGSPWERFNQGVQASGYRADRAFPAGHHQHPKVDAGRGLGPGVIPLGGIVGALAPKRLPLNAARIGDHLILTVPGEPTTLAGYRLERAALDLPRVKGCVVAGYSGTYAGYWVTPEEYDLQRYEASSTLFGRGALPALQERLVALALSTLAGEPA